MRKFEWKYIFAVAFVLLLTILMKRFFAYNLNSSFLEITLTLSGILFGLIGAFFISELWSRYVEIRAGQARFSSNMLKMIDCAKNFYRNKRFEAEFKKSVEKYVVAMMAVRWEQMEKEVFYFEKISEPLNLIELKSEKDKIYFDNLLDRLHAASDSIYHLEILGKEKLFASEWIILVVLSAILFVSSLVLPVTSFLTNVISLAFPLIVSFVLILVYDLDMLGWSMNSVSFEPGQRIFDAIGVKRFYKAKHIKKLKIKKTKNIRTEGDLTPELRKIVKDIVGS